MLGVILLLVSIITYINGNKRWSYLIFISFCGSGFYILTDSLMGLKNQDAALLYSICILLYSHFYENKIRYRHSEQLKRSLKLFLAFMILNVLFSIVHYGLDLIQIIQGGRRYFIVFSFFFLQKTRNTDINWLIRCVIKITFITSILYIIQCFTGLPVLPESERYFSNDSVDGTLRYYNFPPYLDISIFVLVFGNKFFRKKSTILYLCTMLIALFCTQGRTFIIGTLIVILVGLYLNSSFSKAMKYVILGTIVIIPFMPILIERFESGDKSSANDLISILNGDFMKTNSQFSGTMTYRFALVYERMSYLTNRPIGEQIFGMGLLSDQQTQLVRRMYNFQIGLRDRETGDIAQLSTPDIAYGNLICRLGFVGMILYLAIWGVMLFQSYKNKKQDALVFCLFLYLLNFIFTSFSGATISYSETIILPMLLIAYMDNEKEKTRNNIMQHES